MNNKTFNCTICEKNYLTYKSLWNHNNKFHNNNKNNIKISLLCNLCNNSFNTRASKCLHKKKCKLINNNTINSNNTINGNNNNNNVINITINNIGKENVRDLTNKEIKNLIKNKKEDYLIEILKLTNFNDRLPENHNFCITSLEGKYVSVLNSTTQKIDKINKKNFFDKIIEISHLKLNDLMFILEIDELKQEEIKKKYLERLIKEYENKYNKEKYILNLQNIKKYNSNVNEIGYNNKNMVLNTWSKVLNKNIENDSDSGSEFSNESSENFSDDTKKLYIGSDSD